MQNLSCVVFSVLLYIIVLSFTYTYYRVYVGTSGQEHAYACDEAVDRTVANLHHRFGKSKCLARAISVPGGSGFSEMLAPLILSVSFHKMASSSLNAANNMFCSAARLRNYSIAYQHANTDVMYMDLPGRNYGTTTRRHSEYMFLHWANARAEFVPALLGGRLLRGFILVRDFRSTLLSASTYHTWTKERSVDKLPDGRFLPNMRTYREALINCTKPQQISLELRYSYDILMGCCSMAILKHPDLLLVKLEDLVEHTQIVALQIASWLFPTDTHLQGLYRQSLYFAFSQKRDLPSTDPRHLFGHNQSWREAFGPRQLQRFSQLYGNAHRTLGY